MNHDGTTYEITGPEDAPVVVLIHGLGLTRAVWQWLLPDACVECSRLPGSTP